MMLSVFSVSAKSISADTKTTITSDDGRKVTVTIKSSVDKKMAQEAIESIVNSNPDSDNFVIYEIGYSSPVSETTDGTEIKASGITGFTPVVKSYTQTNVFESDRFMASCAKGETKTIVEVINKWKRPKHLISILFKLS